MKPETVSTQETSDKVRALIATCEQEEPAFSSLGTPYVGLNPATEEIIHLGAAAVEILLELLPQASPQAAACIAFCLGQLHERRAIPRLKETLARYEAKQAKSPFDYAFIGNAHAALDLLAA